MSDGLDTLTSTIEDGDSCGVGAQCRVCHGQCGVGAGTVTTILITVSSSSIDVPRLAPKPSRRFWGWSWSFSERGFGDSNSRNDW